jgi:predicted DNA-binding protein (MmcQ/YjbR family)
MDAERIRAFVLKLPLVEETTQWGNNLVFWVGDKAVGGKMFALVNLDADGRAVLSFSAGPERYHELLENEGVIPAPYMAHIYWVAVERWHALPSAQLQELLRAARDLTYEKLPRRTKEVLALPPAELGKIVGERKRLLTRRAQDKATAKAEASTARQAARNKPPATKAPKKKITGKVV